MGVLVPTKLDVSTFSCPIQLPDNVLSINSIEIAPDNSIILLLRQKLSLDLPEHTETVEAAELSPDYKTLSLRVRREIPITEAEVWREKFPEEFEGLDDDGVLAKIPLIQEANEARNQYPAQMVGLLADAVLKKRDEILEAQQKDAANAQKEKDEQAVKYERLEKFADLIKDIPEEELVRRLTQ